MEQSVAPDRLEQVRTFLNTWSIPNDTREPTDRLSALAADPYGWIAALPNVPVPGRRQGPALRALRDDLRAALGQPHPNDLQARLDRLTWRAELSGDDAAVQWVPTRTGTATTLLRVVVDAVQGGRWHRLRACPDCGWVFYDSSRNARRTWCSMDAGPGARGCGAIAKTRAYRARRTSA